MNGKAKKIEWEDWNIKVGIAYGILLIIFLLLFIAFKK